MTWLYIPRRALTPAARRACSAYRSAPAPAASTSDLRWPNPDTALWVTSSGTPSPRPSSWRGWKTRPWIRRLSGTTLPASTADRGAARWISSVRAIRASRSASPDGARERTIRATSGPTSPGSSQNADLFGCSSRTSPIISTSVVARSEKSWKAWATALRKNCSRRLKSARPTAGSGSSYSRGAYPTPSATPYGSSQNEGTVPYDRPSRGTPSLETWARTWPTPRACSGKRSSGGNRTEMMRAWRTPTDDSRRGGAQTPEKRLAGNHTVNLADQALGWPTPKASDGSKPSAGKRRDADLDHRARLWPTPNVPNGGRVNPPGTSATGHAPDGSKKQIRSRRGRASQRAALHDADGTGSQGRSDDACQHSGERPAWPPGPKDRDGWERFLRCAPDLEPAVRRDSDGLACRVDRLRLCGNGVVPLVAAHAWRTLKARFDGDG